MREPATEAEKHAFLQLVVPAAIHTAEATGIPASITIAQAILESDWGRSQLAREARNFFGIKNVPWDEGYMEFPTVEYVAGRRTLVRAEFEDFTSVEACFAAHARLLSQAARYRQAMEKTGDPFVFTSELARAGYSTDPFYAGKLWSLVRRYDLGQYDAQAQPKRETLA